MNSSYSRSNCSNDTLNMFEGKGIIKFTPRHPKPLLERRTSKSTCSYTATNQKSVQACQNPIIHQTSREASLSSSFSPIMKTSLALKS
jgi:hypothetical protein